MIGLFCLVSEMKSVQYKAEKLDQQVSVTGGGGIKKLAAIVLLATLIPTFSCRPLRAVKLAPHPVGVVRSIQYAPETTEQNIVIPKGATEIEVRFEIPYSSPQPERPMVMLLWQNWLTVYWVEPLPSQEDFSQGFRLVLSAPAPTDIEVSYAVASYVLPGGTE